MSVATITDDPIEAFIHRWSASSGQERANFQGFAYELCDLLGIERPTPSHEDHNRNDYTFERTVEFREPDGSRSIGRIDLYKRGCFVMEAKQSREKGRPKELKIVGQPDLFVPEYDPRGKRTANRAWDQLMINALQQAQGYARATPIDHGWPPFVMVCDVGHCIEVYADFSGQGKNYAQFPNRQGFRIFLEDLRDEDVRKRLKSIWIEPRSLDPALISSQVTRDISKRLADVSKSLEERLVKPLPIDEQSEATQAIALFLMRCLFTMFAEDVRLLPEACFRDWLKRARTNTAMFKHELEQLWNAMDKGGYATIAQGEVMRFNGHFFASAETFELQQEEIGELYAAARADWRSVDPAIFGTLLEQALSETERSQLGAHYTPREYVKRLVLVTVIEPLRQEWAQVQATA